jgi:bifunctional ADP-heptose synthase (sugar kinase/adenylyltransferase)
MTTVRARLHELVDTFQGRRVVVVGDLVADVYVEARPYKLSREAPVVIARHEGERFVPGGGGNVLANLTELGARPLACGRVGRVSDWWRTWRSEEWTAAVCSGRARPPP